MRRREEAEKREEDHLKEVRASPQKARLLLLFLSHQHHHKQQVDPSWLATHNKLRTPPLPRRRRTSTSPLWCLVPLGTLQRKRPTLLYLLSSPTTCSLPTPSSMAMLVLRWMMPSSKRLLNQGITYSSQTYDTSFKTYIH